MEASMKLDILAFGAHPDDVELSAAGTLLRQKSLGNNIGIVDLTAGELGTRGTAETRAAEASEASAILGLSVRENLGFSDGFFSNDKEHQLSIIRIIRKYRPRVVLANAISDRHPDHGRAAELVARACFLAGLRRIETKMEDEVQEAWRPDQVFHYIQDRHAKPDFVVDITPFWEGKMKAIRAFATQFHNPDAGEPETPISGKDFIHFLEARAREMGRISGVEFAEGFHVQRAPMVHSLMDLS
jgi:bacillithiol biosynthesis deacetylase BshB1